MVEWPSGSSGWGAGKDRTDRETARQLPSLLTFGCRALDRFEEQRAYLFGVERPVPQASSSTNR
jgi:hypothetical protein